MTEEQRSTWTRMRSWLADFAGLLLEMVLALGRALRRAWIWAKPYLIRAWAWLRPYLEWVWAWIAPRAQRWGRAAWSWIVAVAPRLRRPLFMTARTGLIAVVIGRAAAARRTISPTRPLTLRPLKVLPLTVLPLIGTPPRARWRAGRRRPRG